jgi:hypothetical protein
MLGEFSPVNGEHHLVAKQDRLLHLDYSPSSRSRFRSSRITCSATSIWAAKSGS